MANSEHVEVVKRGWWSIKYWRDEHPCDSLELGGAKLLGVDLTCHASSHDDEGIAPFLHANLSGANLTGTVFARQNLYGASLRGANLSKADLSGTFLYHTDLTGASLEETIVRGARLTYTTLVDTDLSQLVGVDTISHEGPCTLSLETIRHLKGQVSPQLERFLRGCGMTPWEIEVARLYDQALTAAEIAEIVTGRVFAKRTDGPLHIGGVFISYSHSDSEFVDHLYERLYASGASVWLDRHDMIAGNLHSQIVKEIRLRDVVLVVLSRSSVNSDWVEHELEMARQREKEESRDILCPIAIDDSWKMKLEDVLWRQLGKKCVLDFSGWKTGQFEPQFDRLLKGLKIHYGRHARLAMSPTVK